MNKDLWRAVTHHRSLLQAKRHRFPESLPKPFAVLRQNDAEQLAVSKVKPRELECDEDEEKFEETVKKVAAESRPKAARPNESA